MQVVEKKPKRQNLKAGAGQMIATAQNDITIPYFTDVFLNTDPTLLDRGAGKGLQIYEEIERDTEAYALLQKRKATLIAREWEVVAGGDEAQDEEAAEFVEECFEKLPFDRICENLLDATLKGFAVSEIIWERDGSLIRPLRIVSQEQRRFVFDERWEPRLLTWTNLYRGEPLPPCKFIVHRFGVKGNRPYGLGLGSKLFFPVLFKREGVAFWLKFMEKFAGPTVVGKHAHGTLEGDQRALLRSLERFHTHGTLVVPFGTDVELLEATRSGSMSGLEWCNYWDKQMSIGTLGETLTTDIGAVGSLAAAQVHSGILDKLVDADSDLLSDTLREQLITWIVDYNFPGAAIPEVRRKRPKNEKEEAETKKARADAALAHSEALRNVVSFIADLGDDEAARAIIVTSGLVDELEAETIDELVAARVKFKTPPALIASDQSPAFAAARLKKKH